ncbi:MAG TPA: DUF2334 domain-containing protein [Solirubrobacteraceae bacterium]|nr:DUF2334 domain-containing protein [Solirubrobacteraceae bacterium]
MSRIARSARNPGWASWSEQEQRNAALLFDAELAAGAIAPPALSSPAVRHAMRVRPVPPWPLRVGEQLRYRRGGLSLRRDVIAPLQAARAAAGAAGGAPRVLVRVDEFPHYQAGDLPERYGVQAFERFHTIMADAGVQYLLAVPPRVSHAPLSPAPAQSRALQERELALLRRLPGEGVELALHGRDHRTRFASPRRRSELCGLGRSQTDELLDAALAELAPAGCAPRVFVPPFNRFDARQLPWLAPRFAVVCGGPESIGQLGFQPTPQWRGDVVYLPAYAPLYGRAAEVRGALPSLLERAGGLWLPLVLHWGWEADAGWRELELLAPVLARCAAPWRQFLAAVERSRDPLPTDAAGTGVAAGRERGGG